MPVVHDSAFAQRLVLLGASNLAMGMPLVVEWTRRQSNCALDIYAASGLGRSYGMRSNVLIRALPGILQSQIWQELRKRPAAPTTALITDIGNDILYHVPPEQIAEWVDTCVTRLLHLGARVTVTTLPLCNLERVGRARFTLLRTLFYPPCRLSLSQVVERAYDLNRRVVEMIQNRGLRGIEPQASWYGFDAIHLALRQWRLAWPQILGSLLDGQMLLDKGPSRHCQQHRPLLLQATGDALRSALWMLKSSDRRWLAGFEITSNQPAVVLADGTRVSFY